MTQGGGASLLRPDGQCIKECDDLLGCELMEGLHVTSHSTVGELLQESLTATDADLILAARRYAAERLGPAQAELLRAAHLLIRHHAEPVVVAAAVAVPLRRDGRVRHGELRSLLGKEPANLVDRALGEGVQCSSAEECRLEGVSLSGSSAEDRRLDVLRLGFRMAELQELAGQTDGDHPDFAQETLDLYVPLADQMGMGAVCTSLEDLSFQILEPVIFRELARAVEPIRREDAICLKLLKEGIQRLLKQHGIDAAVYGRAKGLYSLYRKMSHRLCSVQDILDKIGLRVIVSSVVQCYTALDLVHAHFQPVPGTFDDYISRPKGNGYRALHTCVYPVPGISFKPVEIQIRTEWMHEQAQFGIAAHWRYKSEEARDAHDERVKTLSSLLSQAQASSYHAGFINLLRRHVLDVELVVPD
jgi:(p)ppGpp synthase/HD superfamily hydrolase